MSEVLWGSKAGRETKSKPFSIVMLHLLVLGKIHSNSKKHLQLEQEGAHSAADRGGELRTQRAAGLRLAGFWSVGQYKNEVLAAGG